MKIPELQKFQDIDNLDKFLVSEYNEPLLDYVSKLWKKLHPNSEFKLLEYHFLKRYQEGLVRQHFLKNQKIIDEYYLNETIGGIGFDINKFWYLVLFINDYAYCKCQLGVGLGKSPGANIDELTTKIKENVVSVNELATKIEVKKPMKLSLEVKGNRKFVIDDERTIYYIANLLKLQFGNSDDLLIKYAAPDIGKKLETREDQNNFTTHFWYFAHLFQNFFEAQPPKRRRSSGNTKKSYRRIMLISRIAYLVGLTQEEKYLNEEEYIKGILSKSQKSHLKGMLNPLYNNL